VVDGVHAACMQHLILREAAQYGVTIGSYFEPVNEGAIRVEARGAHLTPVGRALALLASHRGRTRLRLPAALERTGLDALASRDAAGGILLTLANRDPSRAAAVRLALPAGAVARGVLLAGAPLDVAFGARRLSLAPDRRGGAVLRLPPFAVAGIEMAGHGEVTARANGGRKEGGAKRGRERCLAG